MFEKEENLTVDKGRLAILVMMETMIDAVFHWGRRYIRVYIHSVYSFSMDWRAAVGLSAIESSVDWAIAWIYESERSKKQGRSRMLHWMSVEMYGSSYKNLCQIQLHITKVKWIWKYRNDIDIVVEEIAEVASKLQ